VQQKPTDEACAVSNYVFLRFSDFLEENFICGMKN